MPCFLHHKKDKEGLEQLLLVCLHLKSHWTNEAITKAELVVNHDNLAGATFMKMMMVGAMYPWTKTGIN